MLTDGDKEFILQARSEMQANRFKDITIYGETVTGYHPITKEPIIETVKFDSIPAVVSEVSVRTSLDRRMDNGIEIRTGDILVDIDIDTMPMSNDDVLTLDYDGKNYTALAADKLGLGGYNRIEIIGRLTK